ncbi:MAG: hypothetical protein ACK4OP_08310 [Gemmobacter sp.]
MRTIKVLVALLILAVAGLAGYAYFGDMTAPEREITIEVSPPAAGG